MEDPPLTSIDPAKLREGMARRLHRASVVTGQISLLAAPGMIDEYVKTCDTVFTGVGVRFTADELAQLKTALEGQLAEAYAASPRSRIVISYDSPIGKVLNYRIKAEVDDRERLRQLGCHSPAATVRHRTGRAGVGAGQRIRRSQNPSRA